MQIKQSLPSLNNEQLRLRKAISPISPTPANDQQPQRQAYPDQQPANVKIVKPTGPTREPALFRESDNELPYSKKKALSGYQETDQIVSKNAFAELFKVDLYV